MNVDALMVLMSPVTITMRILDVYFGFLEVPPAVGRFQSIYKRTL